MKKTILIAGLLVSTNLLAADCSDSLVFKIVDKPGTPSAKTVAQSRVPVLNREPFTMSSLRTIKVETSCTVLSDGKKSCESKTEELGWKIEGVYSSYSAKGNHSSLAFKLSDSEIQGYREEKLSPVASIKLPIISTFAVEQKVILENGKSFTVKYPDQANREYQISVNRQCNE